MKLQKQKDHNCFLYASAMALDVPVDDIIKYTGHDGTKIWWPENTGAARYRGHHPQEILDFALDNGMVFVMIERRIIAAPDERTAPRVVPSGLMIHAINMYDGVLYMPGGTCVHAVAWDHQNRHIYDPRGYILKDDDTIKMMIKASTIFFIAAKLRSQR